GGFADIYHGQYTNDKGEQVEVALKVLKIFHDQSDSDRRILHKKFAKEALSWNDLKHENIVPFLGVDSATFPGQTMAMVSQWMAHGSVLAYMIDNSPCFDYAIDFVRPSFVLTQCSHNSSAWFRSTIAISSSVRRSAHCLTDFGLSAFVELETSIKSSTRGGSTRWMAPELLLPDVYLPSLPFRRTIESDVWAFACVCCEVRFHSPQDAMVALTTTETDQGIRPYTSTPYDKGGRAMPQRLWKLVWSCWTRDAASRPTVQDIAHVISEIKAHGICGVRISNTAG
ncbi:kinase-like domain-containing protein, partial [Mycena olivaceomarginata]